MDSARLRSQQGCYAPPRVCINLSKRRFLSCSGKRQQKDESHDRSRLAEESTAVFAGDFACRGIQLRDRPLVFSGLIASKWIGLPQYASAMRELQNESRNWGIVALVLEIAALALVLPRWPKEELALTKNSTLAFSTGWNAPTEYLGRCILHAGLCLLGTLGLAILIPLIAAVVHSIA